MKPTKLLAAVATTTGIAAWMASASFGEDNKGQVNAAKQVIVTTIPPGYRDWKFVSAAHEAGELAAYLLDHGDGDGEPAAAVVAALRRTSSTTGELTRDEVLDNITLYWLTNTAVSASRLYWEYKGGFFNAKGVKIPVAVTVFPGEQYQAPRSWTEKAYPNLIYYNKVDKGGHFAAWEQPQILAQELRAAFKSLH